MREAFLALFLWVLLLFACISGVILWLSVKSHASPRLVSIAQKYEGLHERKNYKSVKAIVGHSPTRTPWCGSFVCSVLKKAGQKCPKGHLAARSYLKIGKKVKASQARKGDIVVFSRRSGGHVGFFVGWKGKRMIVVSGNDGNRVRTRARSTRGLIGVRRVSPVYANTMVVASSNRTAFHKRDGQ